MLYIYVKLMNGTSHQIWNLRNKLNQQDSMETDKNYEHRILPEMKRFRNWSVWKNSFKKVPNWSKKNIYIWYPEVNKQ